jgi:hypothetical protein
MGWSKKIVGEIWGALMARVRRSFESVRQLRPMLSPNPHVLRLAVEALTTKGSRKRIMQQFQDCLVELNHASPFMFWKMLIKMRQPPMMRHPNET